MEYIDLIAFLFVCLVSTLILIFKFNRLLYFYADTREKRINEDSFKILFECIGKDTFDEETLFRVYKNRNEKLNKSVLFTYDNSYERFLESFLIYSMKDSNGNTNPQKVKEIIDPIFQRIKEQNPYSNVNARERNDLLSINDITKNSGGLTESEKTSIKNNLYDLAKALEENQKALEKSRKTNKWSIPVSIIGVLLTLAFGILQVVQGCSSH